MLNSIKWIKWMGPQLRIGIARDAVAVLAGRSGALSVVAEQAVAPDDMAALEQGLHAVLAAAGRPGLPLQLVLADDLLRLWQVAPPQPVLGRADLEAATHLRFHTLYGDELDGWALAAHWDVRRPFWAAAVPAPLLAACEAAAAAHGSPIVAVLPHFIALWNQHCRRLADGSWLVAVHGQLLSVGLPGPDGLQAVRSLAMPPAATLDWLQSQLTREAARAMLAPPERVALCGQLPPSWQAGSAGPLACRVLTPPVAARAGWSGASWLAAQGERP